MDILNQIIALMTKEEVRHFKLFSNRTQSNLPRKDLKLFDYVRKQNEDYDEEYIFSKLYDSESKNPFYRLKNRLQSDLNKSLILQHVDLDDNIFLFHLLSLSKFYKNRNNYKVALYFLRKAEKKALNIENYVLLDYIYSELIQLSFDIVSINPEIYIQKRKENREKLTFLSEMDDILAAVTYRMKVTQHFSSKKNPIFKLLEKTVDEYADNPKIKNNPKLRITLYQAVSRVLLANQDFATLEEYLLKTFDEFNREKIFNRSNHDIKLQMITYLVNTLYKNAKFDQSLQFCQTLMSAMEEFGRLHYKKYLVFYYNGLVINYTSRDVEKRIEVLSQIIRERTFEDMPFYEFLFMTNLAVSYFNVGKVSTALKTLVRVLIHDGFENADTSLKLKIAFFELAVRSEINDYDTVEKRLERILKKFAELLENESYQREMEFLKIFKRIIKSANIKDDPKLMNVIRSFVDSVPDSGSDEYLIFDYTDWLAKKAGIQFLKP